MKLTPWKSTTSAPLFRPSSVGDELAAFQREMNSLMNNFFNRGELYIPSSFETSFYPSIDLKEKDNKYLLDADVPGLNESDVEINFHDNILTIKGEKKSEKETKEADYVCVERSRGSFRRDVSFDDEVDQESIKADLKDGVLHIELTKKEKSKASYKKIPIKH